ncbi:hypothetical protein BDP27DRAFT_1310266 [Rhodocollybia butyracea]|uniref:Uncharacterized protein n=1 Tax=Rhodocollybia butyracea TaxID=206335 RepID=A0A9P5UGV0_9AGAR|nr:hypothetical protein BDP27DRAFT_1310266 [Rhodocollybia butyracea]
MSAPSYSLPPTTNELTPSQRLRLVRSTRKLGEMLGETPVINSSSEFVHSSNPSTSISARPTHVPQKKSKALPRPLVLSLHSVPAALTPPKSATTPLSPTRSANMVSSPYDDFDYQDDQVQARRKRMAKLTRTLGENIPPELVFRSLSRPRGSSIDSGRLAAAFKVTVMSPNRSVDTFNQDIPSAELPKSIALVKTQSSTLMSRSASLQAPRSPVSKRLLRRAHDHAHSFGLEELRSVSPPLSGRKSTDTVHSTASDSSCSSTSSDWKRTYRKEAGWSGEWNRPDMTEVMNRLRGLKAT